MRGERQNQNQTRNNDLPRSRALGIIILMFALLLFQVGVFLFDKVFRGERQEAGPSAAARTQLELFQFDPNTICPDSLCLLGFSQKQAASIVKYRSKGGKFRKKSDFAKMYVVSEEKYRELEPYIVLPDRHVAQAQRTPQEAPAGSTSQATPAGSTPRAVPAGNTLQEAPAGTTPQAIPAGSTPQAAPAGSTPRAVPAGTTPQEAPAGSTPQATPAGNTPQPAQNAQPIRSKPQLPQQPLLIDINAADSASLTRLYGIGGYYARKIIEYRERVGNFYSVAQLMEIPGIDSVRFEGFARNITADPAAVRYFSLDTAGKYFLARHPYVGAYAARGILLMREKFGAGACTMENLVKERILSPQMAEKLWHYISDSSF